jgi:8-oxo-dGTP diphosphatase
VTPRPGDVVVAVIRRGGRCFVRRRREAGPLAGTWEFPGGRVEPGEDPMAALAREVAEETGAVVAVGELLDARTHTYADRCVRLRFFAATLEPGAEPAGGEWVAPAALLTRAIPEANRPLLTRLAAEWPADPASTP